MNQVENRKMKMINIIQTEPEGNIKNIVGLNINDTRAF